MMKRKYKIGLLILSSTMLLTACNGEKTERENDTVRNNESTVEAENESPEYAFAIEEDTEVQHEEVTESIEQNTVSGQDSEKWYQGKYYTDIQKPQHYIHFYDGEDGKTYVRVPGYGFSVGAPEMIETEEYGNALRYRYAEEYGRFDFIIDYLPKIDEVIVLFTYYTNHSANAIDYSGEYIYNKELSEKEKQTENQKIDDEVKDVLDGRQFECFETESGEDVIISFRTSWDNSLMCVINEEYYVTVSYSETIEGYEGYPDDDVNSHIIIKLNEKGDLEFTSSGQYGIYNGTYIELPDSGTDGEN